MVGANPPTAEATLPAPEGPRRNVALPVLLFAVGCIVGWRWYGDHFNTRPSNHDRIEHRIDLNRASAGELRQVPGVGPKLAERIVAERNAKGGFASTDDLNGVHGIGDANLRKMKPHLGGGTDEPDRLTRKSDKVDLNNAPLEELLTLPGIGPVLAERIVAERNREPFTSIDDLRRVSGIGPKKLEAVRGLVMVR